MATAFESILSYCFLMGLIGVITFIAVVAYLNVRLSVSGRDRRHADRRALKVLTAASHPESSGVPTNRRAREVLRTLKGRRRHSRIHAG